MKINCNYSERGCPDYIRLEHLQSHVGQCGFAPMICTNEGCEIEINRRDQDIHERNYCQFSIAKCHDCSDIKESQEQSKERLDEMKVKLNETKVHIAEMEAKQDQMNDKMNQMKENVDKMKQTQLEMKEIQTKIERKQNHIDGKVDQMKETFHDIKQTQVEMIANQVKLEADMKQQFEKITKMMNMMFQGVNVNTHASQVIDPPVYSAIEQDIIILGGWYGPGDGKVLNTVEKFDIAEGNSVHLPQMNHPRAASASCVYNNGVIVAGGFDGKAGSGTIELLKVNQQPFRWQLFGGKLPAKLSAHDVIVRQDELILIGGYNWSENKTSDIIYDLHLTPPYTAKLQVRMPEPRRNHRAEFVNGKLYILGGTTTGFGKDAIDSVLVYDFAKNECSPCAYLPNAIYAMSTVIWGNSIILAGGLDKNEQALNDVIMFDTVTRRKEKLPSMVYKRGDCSAVMINDVVFVLGGWSNEDGHLSSVERFTMGSDRWKELPGMKQKRREATAVVKPHK